MATVGGVEERALAERLIAYDTSGAEGLRAAFAFMGGWLDSRDVAVGWREHRGLPLLTADVGPVDGPTVCFHGHVDVVPAFASQFEPVLDGDRLLGRGAYDMKGALATMLCALVDARAQDRVRVRLVVVPDEESDDVEDRSIDAVVADSHDVDFAITGEPTDLHVGVQAKGVLALRLAVRGRAAHGSTPWLGDNAILKAHDAYRRIETLPFARESSDLFDRPSINLSRIQGGDAFNKVPDRCEITVDIRYLPTQDPEVLLGQIAAIEDVEVLRSFVRAPAHVSRANPYVRALRDGVTSSLGHPALAVGRDGASDAISFLEAGIPAVEFGPVGGGHHGPEEWVSVTSLGRYRQALGDFVAALPEHLAGAADEDGVGGGLA